MGAKFGERGMGLVGIGLRSTREVRKRPEQQLPATPNSPNPAELAHPEGIPRNFVRSYTISKVRERRCTTSVVHVHPRQGHEWDNIRWINDFPCLTAS